MLRGRIWGIPTSEPEQGEDDAPFGSSLSYAFPSSSPDLTLADANVDASMRWSTNGNGHVRGMVDKWERESAGSSRSSSRSSNHRRRSESEELGSDADVDTVPLTANGAISPMPPLTFPNQGSVSVDNTTEEPSIEDLLATSSPAPPMDGSWGARAWEELDIGVTVRRVDLAHDTIVPRRDGSGSGSGSSSGIGAGSVRSIGSRRNNGSSNGSQRARRMVVDIFAEPVDDDPLTTDIGVQAEETVDGRAAEMEEAAEAELEAKERALEEEVRGTRTLLEEFRRRLEEVEARVSAMEAEQRAKEEQLAHETQQQQPVVLNTHNDKAVEAGPEEPCTAVPEFFDDSTVQPLPTVILVPPTPTEETSGSSDAGCSDADSERSVLRRAVSPETVSDLPSYVFLVGLGVCTVVLQVVLKRVAGRSLKP